VDNAKLVVNQVVKVAQYFEVEVESLLVFVVVGQTCYDVENEELALKALQLAEDHVAYIAFKKIDRNEIRKQLITGVAKFEK